MADVIGLSELLTALAEAEKALNASTRPGEETALELQFEGRRLAPIASGELRRLIRRDGSTVTFAAKHAAALNKGTRNRPQGGSNPRTRFIDRTIERAEEFAVERVDDETGRVLSRFGLT